MAIKKHSFSVSLMVNEMILDAVFSDMLVIDRIKGMCKKEQETTLSNAFNLSEKLSKTIIEKELYISLIEASTLINDQIDDIESITTLRQTSSTIEDHYLIKKMVEKYEVVIQLFAHNLNPYSQQNVLKELEISRRSAYATKVILQKQIEETSNKTNANNAELKPHKSKTSKIYLLQKTMGNIAEIYDCMPKGCWFNNIRLLIEVSRISQQPINKFPPETVESILNYSAINQK